MTDPLTTEQYKAFKNLLEKLKAELSEMLVNTTESSKTVALDQPIGRLSRMDAIQQQKMAENHKKRAKIRLEQVQNALSVLNEDPEDYGYCKNCDEFIGFKRLKAKPESPLCIQCQQSFEKRR